MPGSRDVFIKAQQVFLAGAAVVMMVLYIGAWPHQWAFVRQFLPQHMSFSWFTSFGSTTTWTNIDLAKNYDQQAQIDAGQGRFAQAEAEYTRAIGLENISPIPYYNRGLLYAHEGHYDLAIGDFDQALKMTPRYAPAFNNLELIDFYLKRYDDAWNWLHKAQKAGLKADPRFLSLLKKGSGREE